MKTSDFKHVGLFVLLASLVLEGGFMCCPNGEAKFKSQCLSHMMPNSGGSFPLEQGGGCARLERLDLEKMSAHVAHFMEKGKSPKIPQVH
jgi:hypothetical protein